MMQGVPILAAIVAAPNIAAAPLLGLLAVLPTELQREVLRRVQWSARKASPAMRHLIETSLTHVHICWPASPDDDPPATPLPDALPLIAAMLLRLPLLRSVDARRCPAGGLPTAALPALDDLNLCDSPHLVNLHPLAACAASLRTLDLSGASRTVVNLAPLSHLTALTSLNLSHRKRLVHLHPLSSCTALLTLSLRQCTCIQDVSPLSTLTRLTALNLNSCWLLHSVAPLAHLTRLTQADVGGCHRVTTLHGLTACTALTTLCAGGRHLADLSALTACTALRSLRLLSCGEALTSLAPLAALAALTSLELQGLEEVADLRPLLGCTSLTAATVTACNAVSDLGPLALLPSSATLHLHLNNACWGHHPALPADDSDDPDIVSADLTPLTSCAALTSLHLGTSSLITDIARLSACPSLRRLRLHELPNLADVTPLGAPGAFASLASLSLNCECVRDLGCLAAAPTACPALTLLELWEPSGWTPVDAGALEGRAGLTLCRKVVDGVSDDEEDEADAEDEEEEEEDGEEEDDEEEEAEEEDADDDEEV